MPSSTSGSPNAAVSSAMRKSVASASSSPPPRHQPWMAAIVGIGSAAMPFVDVAGVRVVSGDGGRVRLGELVDVGAGGERLPGSRDHDAATAADVSSAERVEKLALHGAGERVQLLLALQREDADRVPRGERRRGSPSHSLPNGCELGGERAP